MIFTVLGLNAENVKISGKVIDNEDKPIEFGTVRVAGTALGTNTNLKGDYTLTIAQKDTIEMVFSCVGFKSVKHKLVNPTTRCHPNIPCVEAHSTRIQYISTAWRCIDPS